MLKITNGQVYDPVQNIKGKKMDIWIENGRVVSPPEKEPAEVEIIDATGMIVMAGGVDIHSHIAGPKVNVGRLIRPEEHRKNVYTKENGIRSGVGGTVPSVYTTGYLYAKMGYTTVMEAAAPALKAKHVHEELNEIPVIDKGCYVLMGNNHHIFRFIKKGEKRKLIDFVAWLLHSTGGYAIKVVNPGGVENWKHDGGDVKSIDEKMDFYEITPREIIYSLVEANQELGLPHKVHLHCNNIGSPGNVETTLETIWAVGDNPLHLTHVQFHSYEGTSRKDWKSGSEKIAAILAKNEKISVDVGQVVFGDATTMTADGPLQYSLYRMSGNKWTNADVELETGSGVVPLKYSSKNWVNAMQWAVGLELLLLVENPWQIFLTTDHPNGGPFTAYPEIIRLLINKDYRKEVISTVNQKGVKRTSLAGLEREYTLEEIAIITRSGPAKALGLHNKGHLKVGADADIAIYKRNNNGEIDFDNAYYLIKSGEVVIDKGVFREIPSGVTYMVEPEYDLEITDMVASYMKKYGTVSYDNYVVDECYFPNKEVVPCK